MKNSTNEIYTLVDELFLEKFNDNQRVFMKSIYYRYYCVFCEFHKRKPLREDEFFSNMHRRRIQLYQLCCPYCGIIEIMPHDKKIQGISGPNYCFNCGRGSAMKNTVKQASRFIRINRINRLGLKELKKNHPNEEEWLLAYDIYQNEIISMASLIEVIFREYFEALIFITNFGIKNDYIKRVISSSTKNDFMNIEKANNDYKKAFNINLKTILDKSVWNNLIDVVNLRNMMIHNNGFVDKQFKTTATYQRVKDKVAGDLFRLEDDDIAKYLSSIFQAITSVSDVYLEKYDFYRNTVIASYYLNNDIFSNDEYDKQDAEVVSGEGK